ncbi:TIGR03083 family protein [Klenkia marina]|uniref:TIGR03083 family protein n=1 Tax=Klenkia marina TaxID=1960309 RepID=A0A1G4Y9P8_9ACTN|nr:maleylpyruvate isomerase family mycothiol-dependent enzyme [Klenkia marina]SCX50089.1 TIGR03083 family protein [Klenkia marina]
MPFDPLAVLDRETRALEAALRAARADDALDAPVPGCPGWSVAELGRHTGDVHRWARAALGSTQPPGGSPVGPPDADVPEWYAAAAADLRSALADTPADRACWTFDRTDRTAAFWRRRQAHEAALHRWDVETALGRPAALAAGTALDGLDEVLGMFLPRQVRLGRLAAGTAWVEVVPVETGAPLPVADGPPAGPAAGAVHGPAEALLLLLWRRVGLDDPRLAVTGPVQEVLAVLDRPLTP